MKTSYYAKSAKEPTAVSIAGGTPNFYSGRVYKKLAPKYDWWIKWKNEGLSEEWFKERYYATVLDLLDAQEVFDELGEDAIILCWEASGKFCHRHLVAEWLENELGITIEEIL